MCTRAERPGFTRQHSETMKSPKNAGRIGNVAKGGAFLFFAWDPFSERRGASCKREAVLTTPHQGSLKQLVSASTFLLRSKLYYYFTIYCHIIINKDFYLAVMASAFLGGILVTLLLMQILITRQIIARMNEHMVNLSASITATTNTNNMAQWSELSQMGKTTLELIGRRWASR